VAFAIPLREQERLGHPNSLLRLLSQHCQAIISMTAKVSGYDAVKSIKFNFSPEFAKSAGYAQNW
jgi:hypothetical protein